MGRRYLRVESNPSKHDGPPRSVSSVEEQQHDTLHVACATHARSTKQPSRQVTATCTHEADGTPATAGTAYHHPPSGQPYAAKSNQEHTTNAKPNTTPKDAPVSAPNATTSNQATTTASTTCNGSHTNATKPKRIRKHANATTDKKQSSNTQKNAIQANSIDQNTLGEYSQNSLL